MDSLIPVVGASALGGVGAALAQVRRTSVRVQRDAARLTEGEAVFPLAYYLEGLAPSPRYQQRLELARAIWEQQRIPIWCLGGLLAGMEHSNAHYSKRYLVSRGVDPQAIRTIDEFPFLGQSLETIQEVLAASELARRMNVRRLIVISDLLHLAQIRLVLQRVPDDPIFLATPMTSCWTASEIRYLLIRLGMVMLTLADRRGRTLVWLRAWRSRGSGRTASLLRP